MTLLKEAEIFIDTKNNVLVISGLLPYDFMNLISSSLIKEVIITSVEKDNIEVITSLEKVKIIGKIDVDIIKRLQQSQCKIILTKKAQLQMNVLQS